MRIRALAATAISSVVLLAACGGDSRQLVGYERDPQPVVAGVSLPDESAGGRPFAFRADDGSLLVVYFGYTNCPDVCPTTLSNVRAARAQLGDAADAVDLAMVSVDPDRDTGVLAAFVDGFVPAGHALVTDDEAVLRQAAAAFGASFEVTESPGGDVRVAHSDQIYVVDDHGDLVLTWPGDVAVGDLAGDLRQLLERSA